MTILTKPPRRGTGWSRSNLAHSGECCGGDLEGLTASSSGWQDRDDRTNSRSTLGAFQAHLLVKPCRSSLARRPAGKSNGGGAVAPILFPARARRSARCEFFAVPGIRPPSLQTPCSPASSPIILFEHAHTWPRDGQIWPETGCAIDRLSRNAVVSTFFPWADAHSSRGNKVLRRCPPLRFGPPCGCVADRRRPVDRHRGRGGRGLENSKEK